MKKQPTRENPGKPDNRKQKKPEKKEERFDFGGLPDVDPKKLLGCG